MNRLLNIKSSTILKFLKHSAIMNALISIIVSFVIGKQIIDVISQIDKTIKINKKNHLEMVEFSENNEDIVPIITLEVFIKIFYVCGYLFSIASNILLIFGLKFEYYIFMFTSCLIFIISLFSKFSYCNMTKIWDNVLLNCSISLDVVNCLLAYVYSYWIKNIEFNTNFKNYSA